MALVPAPVEDLLPALVAQKASRGLALQAVSLEMITMPVTPMDSSPLACSPAALTPNLTPRKLSKLGLVEPVERSAGLIPAWAPGAAAGFRV